MFDQNTQRQNAQRRNTQQWNVILLYKIYVVGIRFMFDRNIQRRNTQQWNFN